MELKRRVDADTSHIDGITDCLKTGRDDLDREAKVVMVK